MDRHCERCPYLCKILDTDDMPVRYALPAADPARVISLLQTLLLNCHSKFLTVESADISSGNQLALLISSSTMPPGVENCFHVIAQSEQCGDGETTLWLRYGVPPLCCYQPPVVAELTRLIAESLHELKAVIAN